VSASLHWSPSVDHRTAAVIADGVLAGWVIRRSVFAGYRKGEPHTDVSFIACPAVSERSTHDTLGAALAAITGDGQMILDVDGAA
jgi:hypothetical protein